MAETLIASKPSYVNMEAEDVNSITMDGPTSPQSKPSMDSTTSEGMKGAMKPMEDKLPIHDSADNATLTTWEASDVSISSVEADDHVPVSKRKLPMRQPTAKSEPQSQPESHSAHLTTIDQPTIRPSLMDSDSASTLEHSFAGILKSLDKRIAAIKQAEADEKRAEQEAAERAACEIQAELSMSFESISTKATKREQHMVTFTVDNTQLKDEDGKSITLTIGGDDNLFDDPDGILNLLADPTKSFGSLTTTSSSSTVAEIVWPTDDKSPEGVTNSIVIPVTKVEKAESGAKIIASVKSGSETMPYQHISMLKPMLAGGKWKKGKISRNPPLIQIKTARSAEAPVNEEKATKSANAPPTNDCTSNKLPKEEIKTSPKLPPINSNAEQKPEFVVAIDEKREESEPGEGLLIKEIEIPTPNANKGGFFKDSPNSAKKEGENDIKALVKVCSKDSDINNDEDAAGIEKKEEQKAEFCNLSVVSSASLGELETFDASTMTSYDGSTMEKAVEGHDLHGLQQKAKVSPKKAVVYGITKTPTASKITPSPENLKEGASDGEKKSNGSGTPRASNIHASSVVHPQSKTVEEESKSTDSKSRKRATQAKSKDDKYACYISFEYSCNALEKLPEAFCTGVDQTVETVSRGRLTSCGELQKELTDTVRCNANSQSPNKTTKSFFHSDSQVVISCRKGFEVSLLRESNSQDSNDTEGSDDSAQHKLEESDSNYLSTTDQYGSTTFDDTIVSNSSGPNPKSSSEEDMTDSDKKINTSSRLVVNTAYSTSSSDSNSNDTQWYSVSSASLEPYKSNRHGRSPRRRSPKKKGYSRDEVSTPGRSRRSRGSSSSPRRRNKAKLGSLATPKSEATAISKKSFQGDAISEKSSSIKSGTTSGSIQSLHGDVISQKSSSIRTEPTMQETFTINSGTTHERSALIELDTMSTMNSILGAQTQRVIPVQHSDSIPAKDSSEPSESKGIDMQQGWISIEKDSKMNSQIPTCPSLDESCKRELAALDSLMQSLPGKDSSVTVTATTLAEGHSSIRGDNSVFSGLSSTCKSISSGGVSKTTTMSDEEFGLVAFKLLSAFPFLVKHIQSFSPEANHNEIVDILPSSESRTRFFTTVRHRAARIEGNPKTLAETLTMDCQSSGFGRQGMDNPITAYFTTLEYHKNMAKSGLANVISGSKIDEETKLQFQKNAELSNSLPQVPYGQFPKEIQTKYINGVKSRASNSSAIAATKAAPLPPPLTISTSYGSVSSVSYASARSRATTDTKTSSKIATTETTNFHSGKHATHNSKTPIHSNANQNKTHSSKSLSTFHATPTPTHSNSTKQKFSGISPIDSQIHFVVPLSKSKISSHHDSDQFSQISDSDVSKGTMNSKSSAARSHASASGRTRYSVASASSQRSKMHGVGSNSFRSTSSSIASVKSQRSTGTHTTSRSSGSQTSAKSRSSVESNSSFVTAQSTLSQKSRATTGTMQNHHSNQSVSSHASKATRGTMQNHHSNQSVSSHTSFHSATGMSSVKSHRSERSRLSSKPTSASKTIVSHDVMQRNPLHSSVVVPVHSKPLQHQPHVVQAQVFNFVDDKSTGGQSHISLASTDDSSCMTHERNQSESSYVSLDTLKPINVGSLHMTTIEEENFAALQAELTPRCDSSKLSFSPSPNALRSPRKTLEDQIKDVITNGYDMKSIPPSPRMLANSPRTQPKKMATYPTFPHGQPLSPKKKAQSNASTRFVPQPKRVEPVLPQAFDEESEDIYVVNSIDTEDEILECNSGSQTMYHDVEETDFRSKHVRMALGSFD